MTQTKVNALVVLSIVSLSFALGIASAKTSQAQVQIGGSPLPRYSDIWNLSLEPGNYTSFAVVGVGTLHGYSFHVAPDASGRLPIVQNLLLQTDDHLDVFAARVNLYKAEGNATATRIFALTNIVGASSSSGISISNYQNDFGFGIKLSEGTYYLEALPPGTISSRTWIHDVALTGYWARP